MIHTNHTIVSLLILTLLVVGLLAWRRITALVLKLGSKAPTYQPTSDTLVANYLIGSGLCSVGTVRTALAYKAAEVSAGRMTALTSIAEVLLSQGAITRQQADEAVRYSNTTSRIACSL